MDASDKNPDSEASPALTTELPTEQSKTEGQEVKNIQLQPNVKDSEISGDCSVTAREGLQSSVTTVVSNETDGKDEKALRILQDDSSTAHVFGDGGKETYNKDSLHHSICIPANDEPCIVKVEPFASKDDLNPSSKAQEGRHADKSGDISQPSAAVSPTRVSPISLSPTAQENKESFWPPTVTGIDVSPTRQVEGDSVSSGNAAETVKFNIVEEIEMTVIPSTSQCSASDVPPTKPSPEVGKETGNSSDPSVGSEGVDKLVNVAAGKLEFQQPDFTEKNKSKATQDTASSFNKMSSSTRCLSPSRKEEDPDNEPLVIQKATSSPVLPIIKITEAEVVEEESRLSKSSDPTGEADVLEQVVRGTEAVDKTEATRKPESSESLEKSTEAVKEIEGGCTPESSEATGEVLKQDVDVPAITTVQSPSSDKPAECIEEQDDGVSESPNSARGNEEPEVDPTAEDGQQVFDYASFPTMAPGFRYRLSCTSSEITPPPRFRNRSEGIGCLGSRTLHIVIIVCSIALAVIGLGLFQLAHDGKMAEVYETAGLACCVIALVIGVFSTAYISAKFCFRINQRPRPYPMPDIESATSLYRLMYPENSGVENIPLESIAGSRARLSSTLPEGPGTEVRRESNSTLLADAHELQTEVTGLLQTLNHEMSKQSLEAVSDDEPLTICEVESTVGDESASNQPDISYTVESPRSGDSSGESGRSTPTKKDV